MILTDLLPYPKSRDAIASKKVPKIGSGGALKDPPYGRVNSCCAGMYNDDANG